MPWWIYYLKCLFVDHEWSGIQTFGSVKFRECSRCGVSKEWSKYDSEPA